MKYMGSKSKYAEELLDVMRIECGGNFYPYHTYVEPFVGGANVIDKTKKYENFNIRIGNDINTYLIAMFQAVQKGWQPPTKVTEQDYKTCKENLKFSLNPTPIEKALFAFVGIGCSYGGKWFGGYARGSDKNGKPRNYAKESAKNLLNQKVGITDVIFYNVHYKNISIPDECLIYCDPPYAQTTKYGSHFESDKFWDWCNEMSKRGHKVFVSEYQAPKDWKCIWEKEVNSSLTKETGSKKATEKLFTR